MLFFHEVGDWPSDEVQLSWGGSSHILPPEAAALIEEAWQQALQQPGIELFDGPMCRLESWSVSGGVLRLLLSHTSYKLFFGTNLSHPELADQFGKNVLANPIGVSPALETSDGYLMLGRRNSSVAYYPSRLHPFAGALEPGDELNVFAAVKRELREELMLDDSMIAEIRCTGIAEDRALRQPELIFRVLTTLTREQIEAQVDRTEHHESYSIAAQPEQVANAAKDPALTPVAVASLLLWGRVRFGPEWFEKQVEHAGSAGEY